MKPKPYFELPRRFHFISDARAASTYGSLLATLVDSVVEPLSVQQGGRVKDGIEERDGNTQSSVEGLALWQFLTGERVKVQEEEQQEQEEEEDDDEEDDDEDEVVEESIGGGEAITKGQKEPTRGGPVYLWVHDYRKKELSVLLLVVLQIPNDEASCRKALEFVFPQGDR